jgi:hypothetical protein
MLMTSRQNIFSILRQQIVRAFGNCEDICRLVSTAHSSLGVEMKNRIGIEMRPNVPFSCSHTPWVCDQSACASGALKDNREPASRSSG